MCEGPPFHHEEDDVLRFRCREVSLLRREWLRSFFCGKQGAESDAAERGSERIEKIAARWDV